MPPCRPAVVWVLGFVSLPPLFMVGIAGISAAAGPIEGLVEAAALKVEVFFGVLSNWLGKRKVLAVRRQVMRLRRPACGRLALARRRPVRRIVVTFSDGSGS